MRAMKDKELVLSLDGDDFEAVQRCISKRQGFGAGLIPPGGGNLAGRVIAEICRGWEEMLGKGYAGLDATRRELVAALDGMIGQVEQAMECGIYTNSPSMAEALDVANAAIKKAKGG